MCGSNLRECWKRVAQSESWLTKFSFDWSRLYINQFLMQLKERSTHMQTVRYMYFKHSSMTSRLWLSSYMQVRVSRCSEVEIPGDKFGGLCYKVGSDFNAHALSQARSTYETQLTIPSASFSQICSLRKMHQFTHCRGGKRTVHWDSLSFCRSMILYS